MKRAEPTLEELANDIHHILTQSEKSLKEQLKPIFETARSMLQATGMTVADWIKQEKFKISRTTVYEWLGPDPIRLERKKQKSTVQSPESDNVQSELVEIDRPPEYTTPDLEDVFRALKKLKRKQDRDIVKLWIVENWS